MNLEGKNVVLVAYHLHPHPGYRPAIMHRFLTERRAKFSSYACLAADWDHFLKSRQSFPEGADVRALRVPAYRRNISFGRAWSYAVFAWKVFRAVELRDADLVIVCVPPNIAALPILLGFGRRPKLWIVDIVDLWPEALPLPRFTKALVMGTLGIPWRLFRNLLYRRATRILGHCRFFLDRLGRAEDPTAVFLPLYQAHPESFLALPLRAPVSGGMALCVLGSINHVLDVDSLIRIAEEFRVGSRFLKVEVLGAGESKDRLLRELVGRNVKVIDHGVSYDPAVKAAILGRCHFGYNGYRDTTAIGITYKSIDFASHGCPLLNSVQGDLKSLIAERGCGLQYDSGTETILARKLMALTDGEIDKMSRAARGLALDLFRKEAFDAKLDEVLESI